MLGARIGNYEVASLIGAGGMGAVYQARHTLLGRSAAVKVLLPELSKNRDVVNRFFNEARAATSISHPGIVEIFDFGYDEQGNAYIIMELLHGESLGKRLHREGRMPLVQAFTVVRQVAGALAAAHDRQILHRDLKPDNIFLVKDPEIPGGERIKLLDFGIAKLMSQAEQTTGTKAGVVMGTPAYMSPEQCRGSGASRLDGRSDLYALGCVFYELLTGRPPFLGDGDGDVIAHHLYFPPEPVRALAPDVPPEIEALVLRLLHKDPAGRPASAAALIAELDALQAALGLEGPPRPTTRPPATTTPNTLNGAATVLARPAPKPTRARTSRTPLLLGGGAAALATAALTAWLLLRTTPPAGPVAPAARPAAQPAPAPATPPPAAPAPPPVAEAPRTVLLQFLVRPDDARYELTVDGRVLGAPQVELTTSREQKVEVVVTAKGYETYHAKILPTSDQILTIDLRPTRSRKDRPRNETPHRPPRVDRVDEL